MSGGDEVALHVRRAGRSGPGRSGRAGGRGRRSARRRARPRRSSSTTNVGVSVRIVPRPGGRDPLAGQRAGDGEHERGSATKRANTIVKPPSRSAKVMPWAPTLPGVGLDEAGVAGERRAVVVGLREVGVEGLGEALRARRRRSTACRTCVADRRARCVTSDRQRREQRRRATTSLISRASIFLPRYSGVRPTISPPMKTASRTKSSIEYRPVPTPPKIDLADSDRLANGTAPPMPVSDSSAALTAPHEVTVVTAVHSAESAIPKRCSLPSRLPPVEPSKCVRVHAGGVLRGRAVLLGDVDDDDADDEQRPIIAREDRPALAAAADHAPVGVRSARPG